MGIYDRDYYRREGPSFLQSFTGQGQVCKWLILINIAFFVVQLLTLPAKERGPMVIEEVGVLNYQVRPLQFGEKEGIVTEALDLSPDYVAHGQVWRLLTYAFLHGGFWHILFNMLFLWWFGHEVEYLYGWREFLLFYLVSAFLGGVFFTLWSWSRGSEIPCLGASGAVTAAMVLYALHYPTRLIYIWFILPIPIWLFVLFQVAQDTYIFASGQPTLTAVTVHLAGAAFAFGYYKLNWRLAPLWNAVVRLRLPGSRPRLRVYREEPPTRLRRPVPAQASDQADDQLEAQVDAVLEKVARHGQASLTESEKALLVRASEVYKRKRS
jgi:membrane associated rhomboid family serine protease